jgi:hypothetical protein
MESWCYTVADQLQDVPEQQRAAVSTVMANSNLLIPPADPPNPARPDLDGTMPAVWCTSKLSNPPVPCGRPYVGNGNPVTTGWWADATEDSADDKVWLPKLPVHDTDPPQPSSGFSMPAWNGPCQVFFPGVYNDNVVISGPDPTYFVSGVYYFKKTLRITGNAKVVVGQGSEPGCVESDSLAALEAWISPGLYPSPRQVDGGSGVGGTFIFGELGRLVIDDGEPGSNLSLIMNRRVEQEGSPEAPLNNISIMSVNGVTVGGVTTALEVPGQLSVPASVVHQNLANSAPEPSLHGYSASTLVSPPVAMAPATLASCASVATATVGCPIIDYNMSTSRAVKINIPGYISVPQGAISIVTTGSGSSGKWVSFGGGMLAAQLSTVGVVPEFLQAGILNPVVQKTFKIVTTTTSGSPTVTLTALVQINATGGYAVNSSVVGNG